MSTDQETFLGIYIVENMSEFGTLSTAHWSLRVMTLNYNVVCRLWRAACNFYRMLLENVFRPRVLFRLLYTFFILRSRLILLLYRSESNKQAIQDFNTKQTHCIKLPSSQMSFFNFLFWLMKKTLMQNCFLTNKLQIFCISTELCA